MFNLYMPLNRSENNPNNRIFFEFKYDKIKSSQNKGQMIIKQLFQVFGSSNLPKF